MVEMKERARGRRRAGVRVVLILAIASMVLVTWAAGAGAAPDVGAVSAGGHPDLALAAPASGPDAIAALGADLPAVAVGYGLSSDELIRHFTYDAHLVVDTRGHLFYQDAPAGDAGAPEGESTASSGSSPSALAPLADTFLLHSLAGAQRVIYLDFKGETLSNNVWTASYNGGADIVAPAFDTDGNPASFSDSELTCIQQTWQRVAEDYAPFAVDVTTEDPGAAAITRSSSSDQYYGMRVLISPISSYVGNYGGVAYVGIFNMVGDYYKPALVFPENLAKNERYIAEASSHENGHTLALYHDGTTTGTEYYAGSGSGVTGWAPIMGVGYYQSLTQWSKGEYLNANNTQDDMAVITQYGAPLRTDDCGNTLAAATALTGSGQLSASGSVGPSGDVDVYTLTSGPGTLTVSAAPAERGPNLDILLQLMDTNGNVIASSNPVDQLTASVSTAVAQGRYYVAVSGTGMGDPLTGGYSAYGSVGKYALSATVPGTNGNVPPVAIISANPTSGDAPLPVSFNGSGSYDPDGTIASYAWAFGDGASAGGATAQHTYASPGSYTATLTVTDNLGAPATATVSVTVQQGALPTRYEQTSTLLAYQGSWSTGTSTSYSGKSYKYTSSASACVTIAFSGTRLDWIAKKAPGCGLARVSLDSNPAVTVDLYNAATLYKQTVWSSGPLPDGAHLVRIEFTATKNAKATGTAVNLDALDVVGTLTKAPLPTRAEQSSSLLAYLGSWSTGTSSSYSGRSYTYTASPGASVTIAFTGISLDWIAKKGSACGLALVTLDSNPAVTVDLYNATALYKQRIWSSGFLPSGPHTVTITCLGSKNAKASSTAVNLDAVDVIGTLTTAR
jgi:PKD repeat protein